MTRLDIALTLLLILLLACAVALIVHLAARVAFALADRSCRRRHRLLAEAKAAIDARVAELQRRADDRLDTCPDLDAPVPYLPASDFEQHVMDALVVANDFPCCETDSLREQLDFQTWEKEF